MSTPGSFTEEDEVRLEQAATWRVRVEENEAVAQSYEFLDWFSDAANQEAYARASSSWAAFDDLSAQPEFIAIRRDALNRARKAARWKFVPRRNVLAAIAATFIGAFVVGLSAWQIWFAPLEYATGIGERRAVTLKDGSRISLDSNTVVRVEYSKSLRRLVLERGRARFDVSHDVNRPFTVTAGNETVVAVGTSFNVERLNTKVLVTLIEGRVVVKTATAPAVQLSAPPPKTTPLIAGQELILKTDSRPVIRMADLPVATAWEAGRLVFDNEPLGEAVERVNRYTDRPLAVDPAIANLCISGVFNAGDVGSFIDAVTSYFPVTASTSTDNRVLLVKHS